MASLAWRAEGADIQPPSSLPSSPPCPVPCLPAHPHHLHLPRRHQRPKKIRQRLLREIQEPSEATHGHPRRARPGSGDQGRQALGLGGVFGAACEPIGEALHEVCRRGGSGSRCGLRPPASLDHRHQVLNHLACHVERLLGFVLHRLLAFVDSVVRLVTELPNFSLMFCFSIATFWPVKASKSARTFAFEML